MNVGPRVRQLVVTSGMRRNASFSDRGDLVKQSGHRIAVVEDQPFQLAQWTRTFAELPEEPEVVQLASFEQAMEAVPQTFSVWVVDYDLGSLHEESGFHVVCSVRLHHGLSVPCMLMSHHPPEAFTTGRQRELFNLVPKDNVDGIVGFVRSAINSGPRRSAVEELDRCRDLACETAANAFGWTQSEQRSARSLMGGSAARVAQIQGVSAATIRRQWESCVHKSGFTAQQLRVRLQTLTLDELADLRVRSGA